MRTLAVVLILAVWLVPEAAGAQVQGSVVDQHGVRFTMTIDQDYYEAGDVLHVTYHYLNESSQYVEYDWIVRCNCAYGLLFFDTECDWLTGNCPSTWVIDNWPWACLTYPPCEIGLNPGEEGYEEYWWVLPEGLVVGTHTAVMGFTVTYPFGPDDFREDTVISLYYQYGGSTSVPEETGLPSNWGTIKAIYRNPD